MEKKRTFRIERTELHTRVWLVSAWSEAEALEEYMDDAEDEEESFHSGEPQVLVTVEDD